MKSKDDLTLGGLEALRAAFDRSFTVPEVTERPSRSAFVILEATDRKMALRASETQGVIHHLALTPLPSHKKAVMGVARARGILVPVYDLNALLGNPYASLGARTASSVIIVRHEHSSVALSCQAIHSLQWIEDSFVANGIVQVEDEPIPMLNLATLSL